MNLESKKSLRLVSSTLKAEIDDLDPVCAVFKGESIDPLADNHEITISVNKFKESVVELEDLIKADIDSDLQLAGGTNTSDTSMGNKNIILGKSSCYYINQGCKTNKGRPKWCFYPFGKTPLYLLGSYTLGCSTKTLFLTGFGKIPFIL